jgi:nitrous oxidase accessory protein NosD
MEMRPVRKILQIVSALLPSVLLGSVVLAAVLHVPADYATVTEALRRASAGDTVQLASGTYRESVTISFPLTLRGDPARPATVTLEASLYPRTHLRPAITANASSQTGSVVVEGITIVNAGVEMTL